MAVLHRFYCSQHIQVISNYDQGMLQHSTGQRIALRGKHTRTQTNIHTHTHARAHTHTRTCPHVRTHSSKNTVPKASSLLFLSRSIFKLGQIKKNKCVSGNRFENILGRVGTLFFLFFLFFFFFHYYFFLHKTYNFYAFEGHFAKVQV